MKKSTIACFALLLLSVAPARAQNYVQRRAYPPRTSAVRGRNYAKQEAVRLLFGPQGIPALTRPTDPWNYRRPNYYYYGQPNSYYRQPARVYYR